MRLSFPCVRMCRSLAHALWIFPQPLILFVFSALLLHGGYSYVVVQRSMPTQFTSCTNSLRNSHYIGDLCLLMCSFHRRYIHAHTYHTSLLIHMMQTHTCPFNLALSFCFLNKDLRGGYQRLHLLSECSRESCNPRSITCPLHY